MIERVLMQTLVMRDLEAGLASFRDELGFELGGRGLVPEALAEVWAVRRSEHPRFAIVFPPGAERGYLRLVEGPEDDESTSFLKPGLFNAELHSKDVWALHEKLASSRAFALVSGVDTYDLGSTGGAVSRSFATRGPGGAGVFFTTYVSVPPPRKLPIVPHLAGAMFNSAVSTDARGPAEAFYEGALGMARRMQGRLQQASINRILGLHEDWGFLMLVYKGEGDGLIEVDVHEQPLPPATSLAEGRLPPGNSILTLETPDLDGVIARAAARGFSTRAPRQIALPPYDGRRVGLAVGPAGERIELVAR